VKVWHYHGREVQQPLYNTRHNYGTEAMQALYNIQKIGEIDWSNLKGSEGSKGYERERDVQLIEQSSSQLEERYQKLHTKKHNAKIFDVFFFTYVKKHI
jgi:hypothetical protein